MKKILILIVMLMCLDVGWGANISAGTWYVDHTSGTDSATCGASSGSGACAHLNYILNTRTWDSMSGVVVIECGGDSADTTAVTVPSKTGTSSSNYIKIQSTGTNRHSGVWSTSKYRLDASFDYTNALTISNEYTVIDGIQIRNSTGNGTAAGVGVSATEVTISNCIVVGGATRWYLILMTNITGNLYVYNSVLYGGGNGITAAYDNTRAFVYNNTIHDCTVGVSMPTYGTANIKLINNLFYGNTADTTTNGKVVSGSDYNATDLSSFVYNSTGGHERVSQTFTFTDATNHNFHLASNDAGARDYGASDPGSGLFDKDVDGGTRPYNSVWDIGADEYGVDGTTTTTTTTSSTTSTTTTLAGKKRMTLLWVGK